MQGATALRTASIQRHRWTHMETITCVAAGLFFRWQSPENPSGTGTTVWNLFDPDTKYFGPGPSPFMINFRVADLHALLALLRAEGCNVEDKTDESEFGKFGWVTDPTHPESWTTDHLPIVQRRRFSPVLDSGRSQKLKDCFGPVVSGLIEQRHSEPAADRARFSRNSIFSNDTPVRCKTITDPSMFGWSRNTSYERCAVVPGLPHDVVPLRQF
jgi:hypothetical protein